MQEDARKIVEKLGGRWHGSYGTACCPAHDDKDPSLSISQTKDGQILWHCHAGCAQADVQQALVEGCFIGATVENGPEKTRPSELAAEYSYHDRDGRLLYQVVRSRSKKFQQRRPDGQGGWIWNLRGVKRVPYRLPELIESGNGLVFVVEGEKDVDALMALGLAATCNPGGANKWRADFAEYLAERDVVILPDNDEPGRKHARAVYKSLLPASRSVRIVELPDLPPKGDVSDWLVKGGTRDRLLELVDRATQQPPNLQKGHRDWYARCITGSRGQILSNHANVMLALRQDPAWQGVFGYDEMREQVMLLRSLPVPGRTSAQVLEKPRPWTDNDDAAAVEWLQIAGLPHASIETVSKAISYRADEVKYHPLRDYLECLEWDGIGRIEGCTTSEGEIIEPWMTQFLGAKSSDYTRAIGKLFLIAAVARIYEPGCKMDQILILEGEQGTGKSTACRILAGDEYFSDNLPDLASKDAQGHLAGKWLIELAELDALIRTEPTAVKAFLTRQVDRFRPPYGRREIQRPRQCVFIGTTNHDAYLKDETGGRRFWPVRTEDIDLEGLTLERDQLLAEAVHLYKQGALWHIDAPDLLADARNEQSARFDSDVWEDPVTRYVADKDEVTLGEVMECALRIETPRMEKAAQNRVKRILAHLGFERGPRRRQGRIWIRKQSAPKSIRLCG
jgi:predicted P-loop ATPase